MKTAFLVIDVQNDYFPQGKMELKNSLEAAAKIKGLLKFFRKEQIPVIHIKHISVRAGASFFLPGTHGVEFNSNVKPENGEKVIIKNFPNSFRDTELDDFLKKNNITRLVIAGMMTHMCVDTTVRAAFDLGYECVVAGDCCATGELSFGNEKISAENVQLSFLAALNGTFSKVVKSDEVYDILK